MKKSLDTAEISCYSEGNINFNIGYIMTLLAETIMNTIIEVGTGKPIPETWTHGEQQILTHKKQRFFRYDILKDGKLVGAAVIHGEFTATTGFSAFVMTKQDHESIVYSMDMESSHESIIEKGIQFYKDNPNKRPL